MRHLKPYNKSEFSEDVTKIYDYLKGLITKYYSENFGDTVINNIRLEHNIRYSQVTDSIIFEVYRNYLVIQFDYKEDGLWIKYLNSCQEPLKSDINILGKLFDNIAIKKTEYGWNLDKNKLLTELNNIDFYYKLNKYNV